MYVCDMKSISKINKFTITICRFICFMLFPISLYLAGKTILIGVIYYHEVLITFNIFETFIRASGYLVVCEAFLEQIDTN